MVEAAEPPGNRSIDEVGEGLHTSSGTYRCLVEEIDAVHLDSDDEAAKAAITNENVCTLTQQEVRHAEFADCLQSEH